MKQKWTLHVENFAKIKSADVTLSPLMCFVGNNNSGKSYIMSLLWGILTLSKDLFPKKVSDAKLYKECELWLKTNLDKDIIIDETVYPLYVSWFSELVNTNKKELTKRIFNYDVTIGKIRIKDYSRNTPITIKWDKNRERFSTQKNSIIFPQKENYTREDLKKMNEYICWYLLMGELSAPLLTQAVKGRRNGEPVYLPASRTGFMLTFPQLVDSSIQASYSSDSRDMVSPLTLPYVDFLQMITRFDSYNGKNRYQKLIDFMENRMTNGDLTVKKQMLPIIKYRPKGTAKDLPLYVASSIISETAPLLLLFKSNVTFNTLIVEEPEAHLHPELQQQMARIIIRIVNLGIPVWMTTHSDTIIQHINNMIKLNKNENKSELMCEFQYDTEDMICGEKINMYQFRNDDGMTLLERLECGKYGFAVKTFNDSLQKILDEVYAFQDGD